MKRETVITGVGCVTSLGNIPEQFYQTLDYELNRIKTKGIFYSNSNECRIKEFYFYNKELLQKYPRLDLSCQYILQATKQAIEQANIDLNMLVSKRIGVIIGSTYGLLDSQEKFLKMLYRTGKGSPMYFQQTANNLLSGIIAYEHHINGFNMTLYNGWTAGLDSILLAEQLISDSQLDIVIAGGIDILTDFVMSQYHYLMGKNSFRDYFLPGEGVGILLLEAKEYALQRKQQILGQVLGGEQCFFFSIKNFKKQLEKIIFENKDKCYFANTNGTNLDIYEREIIDLIGISSINLKSIIGECGAASGVLQVIYALYNGKRSLIMSAALDQISIISI